MYGLRPSGDDGPFPGGKEYKRTSVSRWGEEGVGTSEARRKKDRESREKHEEKTKKELDLIRFLW